MRLLVFGPGYTAGRIIDRLRGEGWEVAAAGRDRRDGVLAIDDVAAVAEAIGRASHILSSVPPAAEADPVLARWGGALAARAAAGAWIGYLSSTGVYGDTGGAWVDESAVTGEGRRGARAIADAGWLALGARVFRLPGIYGPGRSALDRLRTGQAHRVDAPGQVFSRIHVDDIVSGVVAGLAAPAGAYNLADDAPCHPNDVIDFAARLLGLDAPPLVPLAALSAGARAFYAESRRVATGKARRVLGWRPAYPDYRAGLRALSATTSPASASSAPSTATTDQR